MRYPLVITNGTLVTATASFAADIAVDGEQIVAIGRNLTGEREIDATGKLVTPGAVDIHVHHEMALGNGVVSADDFFTGTRAAALGGTTAIVDFVEPHPEQSLLDGLAERRAAADPKVVIDYGLHMTISPREIAKLDQCRAAVAAGCATFKLYMAYGFRLHDGELLQALQAIKAAGALPVVHAENWDVINVLIDENLAADVRRPTGTRARARRSPKARQPGDSSTWPNWWAYRCTSFMFPAPRWCSASPPPAPAGCR
jgi:dihydropyrimidinase